MRVILLFVLLVLLAAGGYYVAKQQGWIGPLEPIETDQSDVDRDDVPEEADTGIKPPRFDIVRVDRSGFAVIAGVAAPGSEVTIYANGEELETETAGSDGTWAINTETPLKSGPVELTLSMTTTDGLTIQSDETIVIYVPEQ